MQKDDIDYKEIFSVVKYDTYTWYLNYLCHYYNESGIDTIRYEDCISVWFLCDLKETIYIKQWTARKLRITWSCVFITKEFVWIKTSIKTME